MAAANPAIATAAMPPTAPVASRSGERRLLLSAFGIHMGGGLVLLDALLAAGRSNFRECLLDARLATRPPAGADGPALRWVARSFLARAWALIGLAGRARAGDTLLCFNSLPPLRRCAAHVVCFVQAPHFVGAHKGIKYMPLTRVRLFIERAWFHAGLRHCDEVWVQTESMALAVRRRHPDCRVEINALIDETLLQALSTEAATAAAATQPESHAALKFFYPADGVGHKNHRNLLQAWQLLAERGLYPRLLLTLAPAEWQRVLGESGADENKLSAVDNLGRISRQQVLAELRGSSALIFPSKAETFGIPMLEATAFGVPVVASERDFVRDVCTPAESFDPDSPRSIARAVERFATGDRQPARKFLSAAQFVAALSSRRTAGAA